MTRSASYGSAVQVGPCRRYGWTIGRMLSFPLDLVGRRLRQSLDRLTGGASSGSRVRPFSHGLEV